MRTLQSVADHFPRSLEAGLTDAEATDSRARFGANRLTPLPREPVWRKFLVEFDEPIVRILLAASLLKIVVDLFDAGPYAGAAGLLAVAAVVAAFPLLALGEWLPAALFGLGAVLVGASVGLGHPSYEGLAVMLAVALATGVAFLSEYRSDREFERLNERKEPQRVKLVRDGAIRTFPLEDVVVGDLVALEAGDEVPTDGRVVRADDLRLDQSLMTGESEAQAKSAAARDDDSDDPGRPGCLYRGTQVVDGVGRMVATNVGDDTMLGQIARRLSGDPSDAAESADGRRRVRRKLGVARDTTPLQEKLAALAGLISRVGYAAAAAIFLALLLRGAFLAAPREVFVPATGAEALAVVRHLLEYFVYMVVVVVVAVPEGLPMSVTVSLALAVRKMTRANSLVRQLAACETIGSATVICTDKTGTLTQNRMRVERVFAGGADRPGVAVPAGAALRNALGRAADEFGPTEWIALNAAVNSNAALDERDGRTAVVGNSTEGALLFWLRDTGAGGASFRAAFPAPFASAFSSETKRMTSVVRVGDRCVCLVKGAPEIVLGLCTRVVDGGGRVRELADADRAEILRAVAGASSEAMRTLAFAHAVLPAGFPSDGDGIRERRGDLERGLAFAGFVGIRDPLRDDAKEALTACRAAGIEVKMITGDNLETARAVAGRAGMLDGPDDSALTSDEFNSLTDGELRLRLPRLRILARARPLDKYRMVRQLQELGHVVAMTGDGTNDAPSLKAADVGLAMGLSGTEVAKEASKIVLLDDAFSTIVKAVHWGRALYENIQRFIQFQLTINVSALTIAFLGPLLGLRPPFTVLQLLWINVIMDTFAAIALCSEPPRPGLMRVPPKRRRENILTPAMVGNVLVTAAFFVVAMMSLLLGMRDGGWFLGAGAASSEFADLSARQVTVFFTTYVAFQVWNQINCRSLTPRESGLSGLAANPQFVAIASLTVVGQFLIVTFGGRAFGVEPLGWADWLGIAVATSSVLAFAEVARRVRRAL